MKTKFKKYFFLHALSMTALLAGGVPAMAADAPAKSDGVAATLRDTAITTKVKAKLMADSGLKKSDISVSTFNGVVALSGTASTPAAKALAETDAKSVENVKSVDASALVVSTK